MKYKLNNCDFLVNVPVRPIGSVRINVMSVGSKVDFVILSMFNHVRSLLWYEKM